MDLPDCVMSGVEDDSGPLHQTESGVQILADKLDEICTSMLAAFVE